MKMEISTPIKFRLSRPEEADAEPEGPYKGQSKTFWYPIGNVTLIQAKNGELRLLCHINHIPGQIIGFLDKEEPFQRRGPKEEGS